MVNEKEEVQLGDFIVNFDVVSLFTNVPIVETLEISKNKYKSSAHVMDIIRHCEEHKLHLQGTTV